MKRFAALLVFAVACPAHADWKGPYVGAGVGAFWGVSNWTPNEPFAPFPDTPLRMDFDGVLFSGKLGYRMQASNFVFGIEGEYSQGRVDESAPCIGDATALTCEAELRSQIKITGQMGYALGDWLPYLSVSNRFRRCFGAAAGWEWHAQRCPRRRRSRLPRYAVGLGRIGVPAYLVRFGYLRHVSCRSS